MPPRTLFVAGATGATGQVLVSLATQRGVEVVPHVRPQSAGKLQHPRAAAVELSDRPGLLAAMRGCTTVLQLIGTMRARFSAGDTYETSDIGSTRQLVDAAKEVGVDHLILLSSLGAGRPMGAYLRAKARAEALVQESGLAWTVFRPSFLEGPDRRPPPLSRTLTRLLGMKRYEPITLHQLASAMLICAIERAPLSVALEGVPLWERVEAARVAGIA